MQPEADAHAPSLRGLEAAFRLKRGSFSLEVEFTAQPGETVALVGSNGAGKSTLLRALAGLLRIDEGSVRLDGVTLDSGAKGPYVPPEKRRFGVMPQGLALFPHKSVLENILYGPSTRWAGVSNPRGIALDALTRVGLSADDKERRPRELSGGEAQRVALARALVGQTRVLLLDEPISAVDAATRATLLPRLRAWIAAFKGPRVIVVHDARDALALADHVVVLEQGRVVQAGTMGDLARSPRTQYVADFIGTNALHGHARGTEVTLGETTLTIATPHEGPVSVSFHPRTIALFKDRPHGSPRNAWQLTVKSVEPSLDRVRVVLSGALDLVAEVTESAAQELDLRPGKSVWATVKATVPTVEPA